MLFRCLIILFEKQGRENNSASALRRRHAKNAVVELHFLSEWQETGSKLKRSIDLFVSAKILTLLALFDRP